MQTIQLFCKVQFLKAKMASDFVCLLFFLLLLPCLSVAQSSGNLTVGDSLTAGDNRSLVSASEDFAFGFHQLDRKDLYLLAIWYYKIPDTIVWYANGDDPAPEGSKVQLTSENGLFLTNPKGGEIWKSPINMSGAAYGHLRDTGNFVVENTDREPIWQSFDQPTDTLLPTQTMDIGGTLSSRLSETNFSQGRFQFRLIPDGNAVLNTNNLATGVAYDAYFWSNTFDPNVSNAGYQVVFNESGYLYVLRRSNTRVVLTPGKVVPAAENYHRATLNFDGVFVLYSYPKNATGNANWSIIRTMPDNICTAAPTAQTPTLGNGPCGVNGICALGTDKRPICSCPPRFSLLDPIDNYGGCKPDFPTQSCEADALSSSADYDLVERPNTNWPFHDYERYTGYDVAECKNSCLQDCLCNVAVFGQSGCWKKKLPLSNGVQGGDIDATTFIKVPKGNSAPWIPTPPAKNKDGIVLLVSVLLGGSVFVNIILLGAVSFLFFFLHQKKKASSPQVQRTADTNLLSFSYQELSEATNEFKEELGRGSFGIVYKGMIERGSDQVPVAVKKLERVIKDSEKEFKTEMNVIGQTHHKNLVKLIGYCNEEQHRLLVYECLSGGTLASYLFGDNKPSWHLRTHIAFGIARGLLYLHEECSTQIIHCDIKPQNILLDDYYNARISDFGLAKLLLLDQSQTYTSIRGTKGYVAPEWFRNLPITAKVDVYSFGVLLLEIICCRRSVGMHMSGSSPILSDWAYDCYTEGTISHLVRYDEEALKDMKNLERFVMVAIWCIQEDPSLRPAMKKVMLMLEGIIQVPPPPCPSPISIVN